MYLFWFQAILSRKLNVPEVLELIKKVENMSITADSPHVRRECRQVSGHVTVSWLVLYPFKSCLMKPHLFIRQLLLIWIPYDICVNFILKNVSVLCMSIYTLDFFLLCYKALYLQIALQYILEYPLGKHLNKHLEYYVTQLSYEMEMGRESALEMLATIFSSFPQVFL